MWQPRQPTDSKIRCPSSALPRPGNPIAGSCSAELAKRYATTASISTSLRTASSEVLVFELYQTLGIQVLALTARGSRIHRATHSSSSFEPTRVRFGPGFRRSSNPTVLWQAWQPARSYMP